MVLRLIFKSLSPFEFICVYGVPSCLRGGRAGLGLAEVPAVPAPCPRCGPSGRHPEGRHAGLGTVVMARCSSLRHFPHKIPLVPSCQCPP